MAHGDNEKSGAVFLPHRCTTKGPSLSDSFPRDFTDGFMQINIDFSSSVFNLSIFLIEFIFSSKVIRGKGRFVEGES